MKLENIKNLVIATAEADKEKIAGYIRNPEYSALRNNSTATRWNQFEAGKITREQAEEYAITRMIKQTDKRTAEKLARLESYENAEQVKSVSISVEWKRNRTWGNNPTATVKVETESRYFYGTGSASGCGYDKLTSAIGEALNSIPAIGKMLCERKEQAIMDGEQPATVWNDSNTRFISYGAGYGPIPYFEGGVGMSSFFGVFKVCGMDLKHEAGTKTTDYFYFERKEQPVEAIETAPETVTEAGKTSALDRIAATMREGFNEIGNAIQTPAGEEATA
jgi:hypothetical protein